MQIFASPPPKQKNIHPCNILYDSDRFFGSIKKKILSQNFSHQCNVSKYLNRKLSNFLKFLLKCLFQWLPQARKLLLPLNKAVV